MYVVTIVVSHWLQFIMTYSCMKSHCLWNGTIPLLRIYWEAFNLTSCSARDSIAVPHFLLCQAQWWDLVLAKMHLDLMCSFLWNVGQHFRVTIVHVKGKETYVHGKSWYYTCCAVWNFAVIVFTLRRLLATLQSCLTVWQSWSSNRMKRGTPLKRP